MKHFSETYANRPLGVHGIELPRFSDNMKEYWKAGTPSKSNQQSLKKLVIVNARKNNEINTSVEWDKSRTENLTEFSRAFGKPPQKIKSLSGESDITPKPTQTEHSETSPNKDHMRNSRWTDYHYNFIQKNGVNLVEKSVSKSVAQELKQKAKEVKTPKALIALRMANRGNYSPLKDQFRSTGFT